MKKVGLYIRVSTLEQAQEGYSIGAQKERLISFCKAHDWTIADIYIDGGYTGANLDRPGMQKLISEIDKMDIVLVYKLDRLSRSQKDTLYLIEEVFLPNNVDFVSLNESFDTSTPFGRAMIGILSVFAQLEREQIKERTHMGRIARAKQGMYHGGGTIPIGYDYKDGKLVVNEYEAIQVRKIYEWYAEGVSPLKIMERLRNEGYTNKYKSWESESGITVLHILKNDVYLGVTKFDDIAIENTHEPIITKEQFDKVKEMREKRQKIYGDTAYVSKYLLTGMIFCARCGARYFARGRRDSYKYYSCYSRAKTTKSMMKADNCDNKHWRVEALEAVVESQVKRLLFQKGYYEKLIKEYNKGVCQNRTGSNDNDSDIIRGKITECDKQISKFMDLFQSDSIPVDVLSARIDKVYRDKTKYVEQLEKLELAVPKKDFDTESASEMLADLSAIWENADQSEKRLILEALIDRIILDGDGVTIEWSFLPHDGK